MNHELNDDKQKKERKNRQTSEKNYNLLGITQPVIKKTENATSPMCIFMPIQMTMTTHHPSRCLLCSCYCSLSVKYWEWKLWKKGEKYTLIHTNTYIHSDMILFSSSKVPSPKFPRFIKAQNKEMLHLLRYIAIRVIRLHKMDHNEMMRLFLCKIYNDNQKTTTPTAAAAMQFANKMTWLFFLCITLNLVK